MERALLVVGASSEVGIRLMSAVRDDYDVIVAHYSSTRQSIDELASIEGSPIMPVQADLLDSEGASYIVESCRDAGITPSHIVHLPAPKAINKQFRKSSWEDFENGINISLRSVVEILHSFLPDIARMDTGRIVLMLSSFTFGLPPRFQAPYVTVKYALLGLLRSLAAEYAEKGITVNGVSPDMMETKFLSELPDRIIDLNAAASPRGRNIDVEEAVETIRFLLSDGASGITGQNICVSGGVR